MSNVTARICDRCEREIPAEVRLGITVTVNYHHQSKLDLCVECEGELTIWLGKHPLWGTTIEQILAGNASGEGYPTKERIQQLRIENGLPPWCRQCMKEGRGGSGYIGVLTEKTDGGTEVYSCGHTSGK
jgi:hypothetical protein